VTMKKNSAQANCRRFSTLQSSLSDPPAAKKQQSAGSNSALFMVATLIPAAQPYSAAHAAQMHSALQSVQHPPHPQSLVRIVVSVF
jgi:hypothetical protein